MSIERKRGWRRGHFASSEAPGWSRLCGCTNQLVEPISLAKNPERCSTSQQSRVALASGRIWWALMLPEGGVWTVQAGAVRWRGELAHTDGKVLKAASAACWKVTKGTQISGKQSFSVSEVLCVTVFYSDVTCWWILSVSSHTQNLKITNWCNTDTYKTKCMRDLKTILWIASVCF